MLKKTIKYTDFDGNERTEDFYFHLTEAELSDWEFSIDGGLSELLKGIINSLDTKKTMDIFKQVIMKSYGKKSEDGRKFIKNEEILADFMSTQAYSDLYMELSSDSTKAAEFINGIIPKSLLDKAKNTAVNID